MSGRVSHRGRMNECATGFASSLAGNPLAPGGDCDGGPSVVPPEALAQPVAHDLPELAAQPVAHNRPASSPESGTPIGREPFRAELTVERYLNGVRIDSFLIRHFRNYTSFRMQRIVQAGQVAIGGETVNIDRRVYRGEHVTVRLVEPPDKLIIGDPAPLSILFEDAWLIVLDKPAGRIVHPAGDFDKGSLINTVQHHIDQQTPLRGLLRPGIIHRLDRLTSGVIVVAKEHLSHRLISIQFQRETISKRYLALLEGVIPDDRGSITLPIGRIGNNSVLASAKPEAHDHKAARTDFDVIERFDDYTLVRAHPFTGRLHQIRVHFAEIGYPVVEDEFYGPHGIIKVQPGEVPAARQRNAHASAHRDDQPNGAPPTPPLIERHALHAEQIAFTHPISREPMHVIAPLPDDMRRAIATLRGEACEGSLWDK